jgi:KaiC/GvpD/RAD55 family RecA-like ATPase/5S rRNA maturation endonuclease (ribonuclease M5)
VNSEQTRLREDRSALMRELGIAGAKFQGKVCRCPYHDDKSPSAGIYEKAGVWRFKCHGQGCEKHGDIFDVQEWNGTREVKPVAEKPARTFRSIGEIEETLTGLAATYPYTNPDTGNIDLVVFRLEVEGAKSFLQGSQVGNSFVLKKPAGKYPLFNRTRVRDSAEVVVVEGEKAAKALQSVGIVATTSPSGAGNAHHAEWSPLAGKTVYLWADNDEKGEAHMKDVTRLLGELSPRPRIKLIDHKAMNLPAKGDAVEYLAGQGGSREQNRVAVRLEMDEAREVGGASELTERLEAMISGRYTAIEWPWEQITRLTRALLPGTITAISGDPGATKSFLVLEAATHWITAGHKVAIFELEEDRGHHLNRALAQLEEVSSLTDSEWVRANAEKARAANERQRPIIEALASSISDAPDKMVSLADLTLWVETQAANGARIIIIDPITAADTSDKPWLDDKKFILDAKAIMRKYGASLILVTHPRQQKGKANESGTEGMAGGLAYGRFTQTVMWLKVYEPEQTLEIVGEFRGYQSTVNRALQIRKTRNGPGAGKNVAFIFSGQTLKSEEIGIIKTEAKRPKGIPQ